jgi:hypothetical protein
MAVKRLVYLMLRGRRGSTLFWMAPARNVSRIILVATAAVCGLVAACAEPRSPSAPTIQSTVVTAEQTITIAQPRTTSSGSPYNYRTSVTLRARGAVGATISRVTATLTEISGAATVVHFPVIEAFGAARIPANGMLLSTGVVVGGALPTADKMSVEVTFVDDNGNQGSVETSAGVRLDLTGDWTGSFPFPQSIPGDWSGGDAALVQTADSVTGDLISRDGLRLSLSGSVSGPRIGGLMSTAVIPSCGISLTLAEVEFANGRAGRIAYRATGRCPGTVGGIFELRRQAT